MQKASYSGTVGEFEPKSRHVQDSVQTYSRRRLSRENIL